MDIDYHFATMYVLSRWADFGSANSKIIATSAQLVDDNMDTNSFSDKAEEEALAKGINIRYSSQNMWNNLTGKGNMEVWIPFHFLPGLVGETEDEQLVCRKHSELSQGLADRLLETTLDNSQFGFRLGVGLHVLADTWAHQGFAGVNSTVNRVQNLIFNSSGLSVEKVLKDFISKHQFITDYINDFNPLGHMAAAHCPDRPYLWWKTRDLFSDGRKNWEEFLEASEEIFRILQQVSCVPVTDLSDDQKGMLSDCFQDIQNEDFEVRYKEWLRRIHENYFRIPNFDDNDRTVEYSPQTIFADPDFIKSFYDEINDHFNWVRDQLIDHGIDVLKEEAVY